MDLGNFSEEVLDAVSGICGDAIVETQSQAADVLDALLRRPGRDRREFAAVLGISLHQLECCRQRDVDGVRGRDPVFADLCRSDAVYAGNVLIQRINEAAHWKEEFRDLSHSVDSVDHCELQDENEEADTAAMIVSADAGGALLETGVTAEVRSKASSLIAKHLDAPEALKQLLVNRLEEEILERHPTEKDYRHAARSIAASLRRNTMLAAGYTAGRVPPQWIVNANGEALAPRTQKMGIRLNRQESFKDALCDPDTAKIRMRAQIAGKGTDLAPPAPNELGEGRDRDNLW